ncbi:GNAT family N-acetyltransferase [Microvirga brassicacearum]|uniref:GNAT family N-acetyltransferase n=1 Tax=Microvirga brassicacearum TaxID=2580413 RepID=A0A5N3P625_9HYPH|nr:GNAT family N-acetyltransferase [Microvirga brassicacearum]KAB0265170.1 GNAT family N-acetyltransferase [Microvirga brassicacearum]
MMRAPGHDNPITVRAITSRADFDQCAPEWDQVVSQTLSAGVHARHAWIKCWLDTIGRDHDIDFRLLSDAEGPLGCAAWIHDSMRMGAVSVPFLGLAGRPMSKRTQVVLARREAEAASVMLEDLRKLRWLWLDPGRLPDEHPLLAAFAETSVVAKAEERSEFRLPLIAATGGWDEYLATRKKSFRKQRKRGHIGSPLTVRTYPEDFNSVDSLLTAIDFVARRSWAFGEQTSVVSVEDEWSFWQSVIRDADARGLLHASCVFDGENPAAFIFGMLDHGVLYALKTAFVASEANLGPGRLAISSFVQSAMAHQAIDMIDLDCVTSRGDYKLSWATEVQTVRSYYAFRQGFCPGLLKTAYRLKKKLVRRSPATPSPLAEAA